MKQSQSHNRCIFFYFSVIVDDFRFVCLVIIGFKNFDGYAVTDEASENRKEKNKHKFFFLYVKTVVSSVLVFLKCEKVNSEHLVLESINTQVC